MVQATGKGTEKLVWKSGERSGRFFQEFEPVLLNPDSRKVGCASCGGGADFGDHGAFLMRLTIYGHRLIDANSGPGRRRQELGFSAALKKSRYRLRVPAIRSE